eukprot:4399201-Pleurochrysis_carterae.AAC.3
MRLRKTLKLLEKFKDHARGGDGRVGCASVMVDGVGVVAGRSGNAADHFADIERAPKPLGRLGRLSQRLIVVGVAVVGLDGGSGLLGDVRHVLLGVGDVRQLLLAALLLSRLLVAAAVVDAAAVVTAAVTYVAAAVTCTAAAVDAAAAAVTAAVTVSGVMDQRIDEDPFGSMS